MKIKKKKQKVNDITKNKLEYKYRKTKVIKYKRNNNEIILQLQTFFLKQFQDVFT